jgi:hypothetical protein
MFGKAKGRLFKGGVLAVATYGAEAQPWSAADITWLQGAALKAYGRHAVGVPIELAIVGLRPSDDPGFLVKFEALNRLAREVWVCTSVGDQARPGDLLNGLEIASLHHLCKEWTPEVGGPMAAIKEAMAAFHLEWSKPHILLHRESGIEIDLTAGSPAMLKWVLKGIYGAERLRKAVHMVSERQAILDRRQDGETVDVLVQADWQRILADLSGSTYSSKQVKQILVLAWGVTPTPKWLSKRGWEAPPICGLCGRPDDVSHFLLGCCAELDSAFRPNAQVFARAFAGLPALQPEVLPFEGGVVETRNGFSVPRNTCQLREGRVYIDGSAKYVGTPFAAASAAAVQYQDGIEIAFGIPMPEGFPATSASGEMLAVWLVCELVARARGEGESFHPGSINIVTDCLAVLNVWNNVSWQVSEKFLYAGFWRHNELSTIQAFEKVKAHMPIGQAQAEGWLEDWKGNQAADEVAKRCRPGIGPGPAPWKKAVQEARQAMRCILDGLRNGMGGEFKKFTRVIGPKKVREQLTGPAHQYVFNGTAWVCDKCGKARKASSKKDRGSEVCPGKLPAIKLAHPSHHLHTAEFGHNGRLALPLVFCSLCGAIATNRVVKLAARCGDVSSAARRRAVSRAMHPDLKVPLGNIRPLGRVASAVPGPFGDLGRLSGQFGPTTFVSGGSGSSGALGVSVPECPDQDCTGYWSEEAPLVCPFDGFDSE